MSKESGLWIDNEQLQQLAAVAEGAVVVRPGGTVVEEEPSVGMQYAVGHDLRRPVIIEELPAETYGRPFDREITAHRQGKLPLGQMTPSYAHAMVMADLKSSRNGVKTFTDEMEYANRFHERLRVLAAAFGLPDDHFFIDTGGPVLHVHPVEQSGKTPGPSGHPLHFQTLETDNKQHGVQVGRGFEAILPTHFQNSAYATPAHPEMDAHLSAADAIPGLRIGKYVRVGGAWNPQGAARWRFQDNSWIGQNAYFISQEHDATMPSQLARARQSTSFPGMTVGEWTWIAKGANILYRTQYVGRGSVVGAFAKINNWVSDFTLVSGEDQQHAFYPVKAWVIDTLSIRDTKEMLSLDWNKVEAAWKAEYQQWVSGHHQPDAAVAEAITDVRDKRQPQRILFIGSNNPANIMHAASPEEGAKPFRRIDVMTVDPREQAFVLQALNGMRNTSARFRKVDCLDDIPIGQFYKEPLYDLVIVETSARCCCGDAAEARSIFDEARRLSVPGGRIVAALKDARRYGPEIRLPGYISHPQAETAISDRIVLHIQAAAQ